jgi:type II secretory pathway component GspD/PulD (secretin)
VAQAVVNVGVDDSLLELGVAFVTVSKRASHNMGTDNGIVVNAIWSGFYDFLTGKHSHNGADQFRIDASLGSTLTMLAENGVARERQFGTIRFHANGDPGKTLHLGGSLKVTPPASGEGEPPEAQDYDYGFKIINRDSRRIGPDEAEADIEIELNGYPIFKNQGGAIAVDQQKRSVTPTVRVPLGKTVAVAGYESLLEQTTLPSGTPFLRHIPILSWFVAKEGANLEDQALLFLVSVRKVDVESEAPMVPNTPMKDITLDANTPNEDRDDGRRGCSPLYWFFW